MSRTKEKVTKLIPSASYWDKSNLARFGETWATEKGKLYISIALHLKAIFQTQDGLRLKKIPLEKFHLCTRWKSIQHFEEDTNKWFNIVLNELSEMVQTGKGEFFTQLVKAAEAWARWDNGNAVDPVRDLLLMVYFNPKSHEQWIFPTAKEVLVMLDSLGVKKEESHLRDICREVNLKLKPAKTGRPKKSGNCHVPKP